jgi:hypothetical protein
MSDERSSLVSDPGRTSGTPQVHEGGETGLQTLQDVEVVVSGVDGLGEDGRSSLGVPFPFARPGDRPCRKLQAVCDQDRFTPYKPAVYTSDFVCPIRRVELANTEQEYRVDRCEGSSDRSARNVSRSAQTSDERGWASRRLIR